MARTTPQVEHDLLSGHGGAPPIAVGSPAWFAWLEQASLFAFRSSAGGFTARRETRARGGGYWRAYRTVAGRQRRAYLGRAADLTIERLHAAAIQLAGDAPDSTAGHISPPLAAPILAATVPLLATKLYLPQPRGALVPRPRLLAPTSPPPGGPTPAPPRPPPPHPAVPCRSRAAPGCPAHVCGPASPPARACR